MNNKVCVNCNQSNAPDMKFCGNCGAKIPQISADDLPPTVLGGNLNSFPPVGQNFQPPNQQSPNFQQPNFQQPSFPQPNFPPAPQNFAPAQPQFLPQTSLRIDYAGVWMLVDAKIEVYFDNQFIGTGSVKNGFSFTFAVGGGGTHVLELKMALRSKRYEFVIPAGGNFLAQIDYSRALGTFDSDLNFGRF